MPDHDAPTALGVELKGALPEGALVVDVLLIAKILDGDGDLALVQMVTPGLRTWEAAGMALALTDQLRGGLRDMFCADEEE